MKRLAWDNNPTIGFWIENDPIRLYYGTPLVPERFQSSGINKTTNRWISLSLSPAREVYRVGDDGNILVIDLPARWLMEHMDQRLGGNRKDEKDRLLIKELYSKWTGSDAAYYDGTEIRVVNRVPSRYIVGFIQK